MQKLWLSSFISSDWLSSISRKLLAASSLERKVLIVIMMVYNSVHSASVQCTLYSASVQPSLIFSSNWIPIFISNSSKRTESLDANKSLAISYLELTLRNIDSFRVSIFFLISRKWNIVKKTEYLKKYLFRASSPLHPLAEMETSGVGETNQGHYHNISYLNILNIWNWEKYFLCCRSTWSGLSSTSWPPSSSLSSPW